MIRNYYFFGLNKSVKEIHFDDEKSVNALARYALMENDFQEPAGDDILTVYDSAKYHFVTNKTNKCCDEISFGNKGNCLSIGYFKDNLFYFAEGGWGHHMIEMDAISRIPNPIAIEIRFTDFKETVVFNSSIKLGEIYAFLLNSTYIEKNESHFNVYKRDNGGMLDLDSKRVFDMLNEVDSGVMLKDLGFDDAICVIQ